MTASTCEDISLDALSTLPLLDHQPLQSSAAWWRCAVLEALPPAAHPRFLLVRQAGEPALLLPLMIERGRTAALTTPYTCLYQPPASDSCDFESAGAALAAHIGPVLRVDGINPAWPGWSALLGGLRRARHRATRFEHFANWHEPLAGRTWAQYIAGRPGSLRGTVRRRLGQAERDPATTLHMARSGPDCFRLVDDYETVHARSWKPDEPHPGFLRAFANLAEAAGCLCMTALRRDGVPVAAQLWTVEKGTATVHKLAHDETAGALSPGTVLTAWTIRRLIEDGTTELDFGRGDDPYKGLWTTRRRVRDGLIIANPLTPSGASLLARQSIGRLARRALEHAR